MIEIPLANRCSNADFKEIFERKGYTFFTKGPYNLNIIGVRHKGSKITNRFDDCIVLVYNTDKENNVKRVFQCTTLPGKKAMDHPMHVEGTAILKEGQYRGAYQIAYHKGKYRALCQRKPLPVYRDGNKNDIYDLIPTCIDKGLFGINIHKSGDNTTLVNGHSYGCQVFAKALDFNMFMRLVEKSAKLYGNSFTYTLINEEDL